MVMESISDGEESGTMRLADKVAHKEECRGKQRYDTYVVSLFGKSCV